MRKTLLFLLPLTMLIGACEDDLQVQSPEKGNYFPTAKGSYWTYETKYNCDGLNQPAVCYETRQSLAEGDALPGDEEYKPYVSATAPIHFVKITDHDYFGLGYDQPKYKFLIDNARVNHTWGSDQGSFREKYVVREVNSTKEIRGVTYHDVIVVEHVYSVPAICEHREFLPVTTTTRYYAKGIGEIYMIQTNHHNPGESFENFLVDYLIAPESGS
jgi:hypothetical protein